MWSRQINKEKERKKKSYRKQVKKRLFINDHLFNFDYFYTNQVTPLNSIIICY